MSEKNEIKFPINKTEKVEIISDSYISIPLDMKIYKNKLYISDYKGDSLLWRYDLNDFGSYERFLPLGLGPNEFMTPIEFFLCDSVFIVYNRWHYILKKYKFEYEISTKDYDAFLRVSTDIDRLFPIKGNKYIASGRFEDCRFVILSEDGRIKSRVGEYPFFMDNEEKIPNFPKFMFHQSMFGYNTSSNTIVSVTSHVLDIWNLERDSLELKKRLLLWPYKYTYSIGDETAKAYPDEENVIGVKRVVATNNAIYLLCCPYKDEDENHVDELWVFNWEGIPLKRIVMDREVLCFCVNDIEDIVYCVVKDGDLSIGKFYI